MAEKTKTKDAVTPEVLGPETTQAMTVAPETGMVQRESFIDDSDKTGTEDIGINDVRLPMLRIAQGLSDQMVPTSSSYIDGLKLFQMFNDLTNEIYGNGPLRFLPIRRDVHIIEFDPEQRGVPLDLNVPPNDPRTFWTKDAEGKGVPPRATTYVDFISLLILPDRDPEPIVISFKCTNKFQTRAAEKLSTLVKLQRGPIYAAYKAIKSVVEKNDEGTFGVFVVDNVGRLDAPNQSDAQWNASMKLYRDAAALAKSLEGKTIIVQREPGGDDVSFNPAEYEASSAAPKM